MTDVAAKTIQNATTLLSRWNGGTAAVANYSPSHWQLALRITCPDRDGCLELQFGDTKWFCGPLRWERCTIQVAHGIAIHGGEIGFVVSDSTVGLVIESVVLEVKEFNQIA